MLVSGRSRIEWTEVLCTNFRQRKPFSAGFSITLRDLGGGSAMTAPTATVSNTASPNFVDYDVILVNSSAGKDSQASLDVAVEAARAADVLDRVLVVHADLGDNEWPGTGELAAEHAAHYGLPFKTVRREYDGEVETILDRVQKRGMWPDAARRWCSVICTISRWLIMAPHVVIKEKPVGPSSHLLKQQPRHVHRGSGRARLAARSAQDRLCFFQ